MVATTTAVNACDAVLELDDNGGVPKDISGSSSKLDMEFMNTLGEFHVFGSSWPIRLQCKKDATFSLDVAYTMATDEGMDILKDWMFNGNGNRTLSVYIPDNSSGSDVYSGPVVLESLKIPMSADSSDPILVTAELKPAGDWTLTTVP